MNRRTSRADFRNELTTEEIAELLQELCIKRRFLCDMQRRLYPLSSPRLLEKGPVWLLGLLLKGLNLCNPNKESDQPLAAVWQHWP